MKKETHLEHSERVLGKTPATPCTAWHGTFGGRCLNCGYDPEEKKTDYAGRTDEERMDDLFNDFDDFPGIDPDAPPERIAIS